VNRRAFAEAAFSCEGKNRPRDASAPELDLIDLAGAVQEYNSWIEAFGRAGYPKAAFLNFLSSFERNQLARIQGGRRFEGSKEFSRKLAQMFDDFETKNPNLRLPKADWSYFCGDAGMTYRVYFRAAPPNGNVMIISAFFFDLCKMRGDPPLDRSKCNFWRSTIPSKGDSVAAGQYYVYARWSDGIARGPELIDFSETDFSQMGEGPVVKLDHP
jgi:hypothetical protein